MTFTDMLNKSGQMVPWKMTAILLVHSELAQMSQGNYILNDLNKKREARRKTKENIAIYFSRDKITHGHLQCTLYSNQFSEY